MKNVEVVKLKFYDAGNSPMVYYFALVAMILATRSSNNIISIQFAENNYDCVLLNFVLAYLMNAASFLEHDNSSFSKLLLSKEVAYIIKQIVRLRPDSLSTMR